MTAPKKARRDAPWKYNHLRRGATYRATTRNRIAFGEYLGMEAPHGDRSILLRHGAGTHSISLSDLTSIHPAAA